MEDGGGVFVVSAAHVSDTCDSGVLSSAADLIGMCVWCMG